jgi:lysozyme family protein
MKKIIILLTLCLSLNANGNSFDYVWGNLVKLEGAKIDKSVDSYSKYGITKGTLNSYNKQFKKSYKFYSLTEQQAKTVAYKMVYEPNLLAFIVDNRVALAMVDWCYNSNPTNATKQMQKMLGLKVDGLFSMEDIKYINSLLWEEFIFKYYPKRKTYFYSLNNMKFIKGWIARLNKIKELEL